ncbi:hypothetical protein HK405_003627, partial [Cladochytrium tenue]
MNERYSAADPSALDRESGAEYLRLLAAVNDGRLGTSPPVSSGAPNRQVVPAATTNLRGDSGSAPASAADGYAESRRRKDGDDDGSDDGTDYGVVSICRIDAVQPSVGVDDINGPGPAADCAPAPAALQDKFREMQDQLQRMQFQHDMLHQVRHPSVGDNVENDFEDAGGHHQYLHHHQHQHQYQQHQQQFQQQQQQHQQQMYHYYPHVASPETYAAFQPHVLPHRLASARRLLSMSAARHDAAAGAAVATGTASPTPGGLPGNPLYQAVQDVLYPPPRLLPASLDTRGSGTPLDVLPRQRLVAAAASNSGGSSSSSSSAFDDPQRRFSFMSARSGSSGGYIPSGPAALQRPHPPPSIHGSQRSRQSLDQADEARAAAGTPSGVRTAHGGVALRTRSRSFGGDAVAQEALRLGWSAGVGVGVGVSGGANFGVGGGGGGGGPETCVWWGSQAGPFGVDGEAIRGQLGERPVVELVILLGVLGHRAGSLTAQLQQQPAGSHPSVRLVGSAGNRYAGVGEHWDAAAAHVVIEGNYPLEKASRRLRAAAAQAAGVRTRVERLAVGADGGVDAPAALLAALAQACEAAARATGEAETDFAGEGGVAAVLAT